MKLRIGVVQINPILGRLEENIKRSTRLIENAFKINLNQSHPAPQQPISIPSSFNTKADILVFPELALTGYNFQDSKAIEPFLEVVGEGPSYKFGSLVSKSLQCYTLIGYPEKAFKEENTRKESSASNDTISTLEQRHTPDNDERSYDIYNSAMLIDSNGSVVYNYRKTHLYETDKKWGSIESSKGFQTFDLKIRSKTFKTTIGICMDLNPWEFKAPFEKYEFANHVLDTDAQLILVPTAWLNTSWSTEWDEGDVNRYHESFYSKQGTDEDIEFEVDVSDVSDFRRDMRMLHYEDQPSTEGLSEEEEKKMKFDMFDREEVDFRTSKYWIIRFNPLLQDSRHLTRILAICNRSGLEKELLFGGSSSIIRFNKDGELPESDVPLATFFGSLSQGTEGVLMREIDID